MHKEHISKVTLENEKQKRIEMAKEALENQLIETKTFTPVTKDNFEKWYTEFYKKTHKVDKSKLEQDARISGREFFMNAKNEFMMEENDENEEAITKEEEEELNNTESSNNANALFYDAEAFDENLDDIDFDKVDIDDDEEINVDDI